MNISTHSNSAISRFLTPEEYVILREISSIGDWKVKDLTDIKHFAWDAYDRLRDKGLILDSKIRTGYVHPCSEVHSVLTCYRNIIGINSL